MKTLNITLQIFLAAVAITGIFGAIYNFIFIGA